MSCRELHMLILQDPSNTFSSLSTLKTFFAFLTLNLLYGSWREKEGKCNGFLSWKKNNTFISLTCIIEPFRTQDEEACNILTAFRNFHVHCAASFMRLFIASSAWHFFMTRLCTSVVFANESRITKELKFIALRDVLSIHTWYKESWRAYY